MKISIIVIIFLAVIPKEVLGQSSTEELALLVASGTLQLTIVSGNGSSSGASLDGVIQNTSSKTVRVDVNLMPPMYFQNDGGTGQNMVATQVYLENGGYLSDGEDSYIEIGPNGSERLMLIAYCADFEKANPSASDTFSVAHIPQEIVDIAWSIANYEAENPNADVLVAAQVAIWLSQGESADDIQKKFAFTTADERLARQLLR